MDIVEITRGITRPRQGGRGCRIVRLARWSAALSLLALALAGLSRLPAAKHLLQHTPQLARAAELGTGSAASYVAAAVLALAAALHLGRRRLCADLQHSRERAGDGRLARPSRPTLSTMLAGVVDAAYAKPRQGLWTDELLRRAPRGRRWPAGR